LRGRVEGEDSDEWPTSVRLSVGKGTRMREGGGAVAGVTHREVIFLIHRRVGKI